MIEIKINNPGDEIEFDKAVKLLKKIVTKSGILQELKDRRYYSKPSEIKRLTKKQRKRK